MNAISVRMIFLHCFSHNELEARGRLVGLSALKPVAPQNYHHMQDVDVLETILLR
jgi:hypothetical protein